jgi:hypothetical protein
VGDACQGLAGLWSFSNLEINVSFKLKIRKTVIIRERDEKNNSKSRFQENALLLSSNYITLTDDMIILRYNYK